MNKSIEKYIKSAKARNSDLGCRDIAKKASLYFGFSVSKSTVAKILKTCGLSSKIGRKISANYYKSVSCDICGYVFIMGAFKYLQLASILVKHVVRAGIDCKVPVGRLERIFEALILYKALFSIELRRCCFFKEERVWELLGYKISRHDLEVVLDSLEGKSILTEGFLRLPAIAETRASSVQIFLQDGSEILIGADIVSLLDQGEKQNIFNASSLFTIGYIDKVFVENDSVFILPFAGRERIERSIFLDLLSCLDGSIARKRIKRIKIVGSQGAILTDRDFILPLRRRFVVGISEGQAAALGLDLKCLDGVKEDFVDGAGEGADVRIRTAELTQLTEIKGVRLNLTQVRPLSGSVGNFFLLSNLDADEYGSAEIFNCWRGRCPDVSRQWEFFQTQRSIDTPSAAFLVSSPGKNILKKQWVSPDEIFSDLSEISFNFCRDNFFPSSCHDWSFFKFKGLFFKISGTIRRDNRHLSLYNLNDSNILGYKGILKETVFKFNCLPLLDQKMKKISVLF